MSEGLAVAGSLPATKKPQALVNITHSRNTHTYKAGFEWRNDIFSNPQIHGSHGQYTFNNQQTALPSTQGQALGGGAVGLPYASFLLGMVNSAFVSNPTDPNWRKPAVSAFMQDTWRVKSALTIDYGLRWDRQAYGYEEHDRRSMFSPDVPNPAAGGLLGATIYEGDGPGACNCRFVKTYPDSFGPRVGVSYQINPKTVLRGGWGITYAQTGIGQADGGSTLGAGGWNTFNFQSPAFGEPGALLRTGLVYDRDALFRGQQRCGHPAVAWPGRLAAAVDSSRRRQDAQAQSVEHLAAARDYPRPRRRRRVRRQSGQRVHRQQPDQPECDQRGAASIVRPRPEQRRRSDAADVAPRLDARRVARLQQAAVCQLLRREHGRAEPEAVPAVRHDRRRSACRSARANTIRCR